jgi:glycine dehydrogenase subunit 2
MSSSDSRSPRATDSPFGAMARAELAIPNIAENEVVRHFVNLSQMNFGVDSGIYPLGSCTMKYNPKICDEVALLPGWAMHPESPDEEVQGALEMMFRLESMLREVSGMDAVTLQPAAGAHGEYTALLMTRAYFQDKGEKRTEVIVPETAHGTNPASAAMAGYDVAEIPAKDGQTDLEALRSALSEKTAALMLTNPNTLGVFESGVQDIAEAVHDAGALLYYDGANFNAILGKTNPGKMGFDMVHFNLHKTFAVPHGGGGPGGGPVGVRSFLEPYLPVPVVRFDEKKEKYRTDWKRKKSIGKVSAYYGNFLALVRAYAYIILHGADGMKWMTERAVLNANYMKSRLAKHFEMPFKELRKHEFVLSAENVKETKGIRAMDIAKRILDFGMHPPTVYFPMIVKESMMIEPTEDETKAAMDAYCDALIAIKDEDPEVVRAAPHNTSVRRVDEVTAARELILNHRDLKEFLKKG